MESNNKTSLVRRLERNQHDLRKMKSALSSYICEPRTPSLFERCQSLKDKLEDLTNSNGEIIQSLREHKKSVSSYVERSKQQFKEFYLLRKNVEDYMAGTRNQ